LGEGFHDFDFHGDKWIVLLVFVMVVIHNVFLFLYNFRSCAFDVTDIEVVSSPVFRVGGLLAFMGKYDMIILVLKVVLFRLNFGGEFQSRLVDCLEPVKPVTDFDHAHFRH
jgi:hypothetical protein